MHWILTSTDFLKTNILTDFPSSSLSWLLKILLSRIWERLSCFPLEFTAEFAKREKVCIQNDDSNMCKVLPNVRSEQPEGDNQILAYSQGFSTSRQIIILAIGGTQFWTDGIYELACPSWSFIVTPCREALTSLKQTQLYPAWGYACWAGFAGAAPWGYSAIMLLHSVISDLSKGSVLLKSFGKTAFP